MKIIVSHDVDHLYASDHIFKDLFLEKMWIRSLLHFIQKKISFRTFIYRLLIFHHNRMNRTDEVMAYDKANGIPSTFFFGMRNGLGMSYSQKKAYKIIKTVIDKGFDAGVHGIDFENRRKMNEEYVDFKRVSGLDCFGIRNHYVRYDDNTFKKMSEIGYLFDSSHFNKGRFEIVAPYKVGNMWEFPTHIMDAYVMNLGKLQDSIRTTQNRIKEVERMNIEYCTILFHDTHFDDVYDPEFKEWYERTIEYCKEQGYKFVSYKDAIKEMEGYK